MVGPSVRQLAALAAVGALAAAGGQAACAAGIGVVGGAQATLDAPGAGQFVDIDSFETPDGHSYLLALRYDRIYTIDVTEPFRPLRAGGITYDRFAGSWFWNAETFRTPDGRVYAAVTGDHFSILDVTDPANPEMVYGVPEGADSPFALGGVWQVTVYERPDGRVHALVTGSDNALRAVDITDPYNPVALGGGPDLVPDMAVGGSAALYEPGDGRIYVMYGSIRMGVSIVEVTDPARPVLVSAIRHYDGDHPLGHGDYQAHDIPAPSSSDVLISDGYAEGLGYANEVAVFGSPDGRTYAMVANGMATIQVQPPGVGREPPQYAMVANGTAPIQIDEPDPYIVPAGIIFLDVTDPHAPAPAGAILYGEDGFDFGSGIRDTAIRGGPVPFPEGHRIDIGYPIRDIAILDSPDGRVHAAVAGDRGVTILDVTDPAGPVLLSHIRDGEDGFDHIDTVRGMDVVESPDGGTHLAMAGDEGVQMADVTDPGEPVGAGSLLGKSVNFANPVAFESGDGRIYAMGLSWDTVSMVDITDPSHPVPLGSIRDGEGGFDTLDGVWQVEALHTPDGRIYAMAAGGDGLQVIEVTDPHSPAAVGILRNGTDGFEVGRLISTAVLEQPGGGGYLLVADHDRGVYTVDVTDPRAPALAGSLRGGEGGIDLLGGVHDMDVFGGPDGRPYALMTGDVGIHTIDMADPATPVVAGTLDGSIYGTVGGHTLTLIHQSVVFEPAGGRIHALLADYTSGIHIIDLTNPRAPAYMGSVPVGEGGVEVIPGSAVAVVASPAGGAYALVTGWDDIQILDITDPYAPAPAGAIPAGEGGLGLERTPWYIITMEPAGGRIHALASAGDRLWVLDVTRPVPAAPRAGMWDGEGSLVSASGPLGEVVGSVRPVLDGPGVGPMMDVAAFKSPDGLPHLVVVGESETVWVVDVADPHRPALAGAVSDRRFPDMWRADVEALEWPGGHAYAVVSGNGEAYILNVTDPRRPALVGTADGSPVPADLWGVDDTALFGTPDGRVHALALGWDFGLTVVDMTDPRLPAPAEWLEGLDIRPNKGAGAVFGSSGGQVYAVAVSDAAGVYIVNVTDTHRPALVSVVRYAGDPPADAGAGQGLAGGPAATVIIPPSQIDIPPEHTEIRISGTDGAGLLGATGVAVIEAPGGRIYAAVANHGVAPGEVRPREIPAGILFIDVTDPSRPAPAGAVRDGEGGFDIGSYIFDVAVLEAPGGRAYMAVTGSGGLHMLDVTDPTKPVPAGAVRDGEGGFYNIGHSGTAVLGPSGDGRLYLATVGDGIQLVDVTDPFRPVPAGAIPDTPGSFYTTGGAEYMAAFGLVGRTYALGTGGDGVHILDVTDPSRPVPAGSAWDGRDGFDTLDAAHHIAVTEYPGGPFLALVAGDEGIQILDMVNPSRPVPAGAIRYGEGGLDPRWVTDMEAYRSPTGRDYLLVAGHYTGIHVVDVTDPSRPVLVGGAAPAGDGKGLRGGCPGEGHLGEDNPYPMDGIHGVDVYAAADGRDYALVTCDGGIRTLDLSDPAAPRLAGALLDGMNNHTFGTIYWAVLYEPPGGGIYALLAAYYGGIGIHILDVTDPHRPVPAGSIPEDVFAPIPGTPVRVVASGDRVLALGSGTGGIHILDVTDPNHPAHTGFLPAAGMGLPPDSFPWYITPFESGEGKTYALVDGGEGALILNISPHPPDGGDGTVVDMAGSGGVPAPDGDHALVLVGAGHTIHVGGERRMGFEFDLPPDGGDDMVEIVDLTDPYAPTIIGTVPSTYGRTGGIEVVYSPEGRAYAVAVGPAGGLLVTDIAGPHAASVPAADLTLAPDSSIEIFRPHDGRAYMVAGDDGVRFIDVTYPTNPVQVSHIRDNLDGFYHLDGVRDISVFESGDGLVYALAGGGDGIQIIDVTNPYRPSSAGGMHKFLGDHSADGVHRTATVRTSDGVVLALAAGGAGRTAILDVTDPRSPVLAGTICAGMVGYENATGMWTAGECDTSTEYLAYVPDVAVFETSDGRIRALITGPADSSILDITDPAAPVQVVTVAGHGALDIISVFESSGGRPNVLLAGDGDIWVGDLDDLTRLHVWGWP